MFNPFPLPVLSSGIVTKKDDFELKNVLIYLHKYPPEATHNALTISINENKPKLAYACWKSRHLNISHLRVYMWKLIEKFNMSLFVEIIHMLKERSTPNEVVILNRMMDIMARYQVGLTKIPPAEKTNYAMSMKKTVEIILSDVKNTTTNCVLHDDHMIYLALTCRVYGDIENVVAAFEKGIPVLSIIRAWMEAYRDPTCYVPYRPLFSASSGYVLDHFVKNSKSWKTNFKQMSEMLQHYTILLEYHPEAMDIDFIGVITPISWHAFEHVSWSLELLWWILTLRFPLCMNTQNINERILWMCLVLRERIKTYVMQEYSFLKKPTLILDYLILPTKHYFANVYNLKLHEYLGM